MVGIGGPVETADQLDELSRGPGAECRLVDRAQACRVRAEAGRVLAVIVKAGIRDQLLEPYCPAELRPPADLSRTAAGKLAEREYDRQIFGVPAGIGRSVWPPAVVALPDVRIMLGRDLDCFQCIQCTELGNGDPLPVAAPAAMPQGCE